MAGLGFGMGLGMFGAGIGQGIMQGRQMALQQAYMKMMQQRQQMLMDQMQYERERQGRLDERQAQMDKIGILKEVLAKEPRAMGDVAPAINAVFDPQHASYNPNLQSQSSDVVVDPMSMERPEQQPVTGSAAVGPLMASALQAAGSRGQEEWNSMQQMKRDQMEATNALRLIQAQMAAGFKGQANQRAQEAADRAKDKQSRLPTQVEQKLRAQKEAIDYLASLENTFSDPGTPSSGLGTKMRTSPLAQGLGSLVGYNPATPAEAALSSQLGEHLISYIKGRFTRSAGWEVPLTKDTTPQMGLPNDTNLARARSLKQRMLRDHESDLESLRQQGFNVPDELTNFQPRTPAEVLGQSVRSTPSVPDPGAPGAQRRAPAIPTDVPIQPPPDLFQPGWR